MKTVLITGASGFLGRHLQKRLLEMGVEVVTFSSREIDLTIDSSLKKIPLLKYDHIFHLAAWTRAGNFCEHYSGDQWIVNQAINTNILKWWLKNSPNAKFIGLGTSVSYAKGFSLSEENYMEGEPIDKFYSYAMTKRMLYSGLKSIHKQYNLNYLYVIPSTLYGKDYHIDGRDAHFIYDLIKKIARRKYFEEDIVLWGDGFQKRELVNINDFVEILLLLNGHATNDIFNIGAGEEYTIREFAKIICNYLGVNENEIKYDEKAYVGSTSKILSVDKMNSILNNTKRTDIEKGIADTINWVVDSNFYI